MAGSGLRSFGLFEQREVDLLGWGWWKFETLLGLMGSVSRTVHTNPGKLDVGTLH